MTLVKSERYFPTDFYRTRSLFVTMTITICRTSNRTALPHWLHGLHPCFMLSAVPLKTNNATVTMIGFMTVGTIFHANSYPEALQCRHSRASRIFKTRTDIIIYRRRFGFHVLGHVFTLQCKSIHDCAHSPAAHLPPLFRSCAMLTNSHNSEALSLDELE